MDVAQTHAEQRAWLTRYREAGVPTKWGYVMTAFGCNYQGDVPVADVCARVAEILALAEEFDVELDSVFLADTVGFAGPDSDRAGDRSGRDRGPTWPWASTCTTPADSAWPTPTRRCASASIGSTRRAPASADARSPATRVPPGTSAARS